MMFWWQTQELQAKLDVVEAYVSRLKMKFNSRKSERGSGKEGSRSELKDWLRNSGCRRGVQVLGSVG